MPFRLEDAMIRLLYLHGFRSSPQSSKAKIMAARVAKANRWKKRQARIEWCCPQLPHAPREAFDLAWNYAQQDTRQPLAIIGSSLGGFYAAALTERLTRVGTLAQCVLLNPAVNPARDLAKQIGRQTLWHDAQTGFEFTREHVDQLGAIADDGFSRPQRYMTIIAKGDEVLDWREMSARYPAQHAILLEGGDHAISDFEMYADEVLAFCRASSL
jgi:uncharacterized protein